MNRRIRLTHRLAVCRNKRRQATGPKTRALFEGSAKLPRLDRECVRCANQLASPLVHHRVLDCNRYVKITADLKEPLEEERGVIEIVPEVSLVEPSNAGVAKSGARWMGDYPAPSSGAQNTLYITLYVRTGPLRGQQVAGDRVIATGNQSVTHDAAEFARHQNHCSRPSGSMPVSNTTAAMARS